MQASALMPTPDALGIIAGSGVYPLLLADSARVAGVKRIVVAAFTDETSSEITNRADEIEWMRVGQLGKLLSFFRDANVRQAIMAGQIAPANLFNLRPDFKAMFLLARLKERNAESIFGAIADQLAASGVELLPATTFLNHLLAPSGPIAGPKLKEREEADVSFGFEIAKQLSALDVGQTIVVKNGTVLAVEAFEGTNEAIRRGGSLGKKRGRYQGYQAKPGYALRRSSNRNRNPAHRGRSKDSRHRGGSRPHSPARARGTCRRR